MTQTKRARPMLVGIAIFLITGGGVAQAMAIDFQPRGRFHFDAGAYDSDITQFGNGVAVRRGRLGVSGKLDDTWHFQIEYDFAEGGGGAATDVFVGRKLGYGTVEIGQNLVPIGMNMLTSANVLPFMERSSASNVFSVVRRLGVRYDISGDRLTSQSMLFSRQMNDGGNDANHEPIGFAQRFVYHPRFSESSLLHIGLAVAYENRRDFNSLRLRDRPEMRVASDIRLIDTAEGTMEDVSAIGRLGFELAYQSGPLLFEAEYLAMDVSRDDNANPGFDGYHVQLGYVVTGESRSYSAGKFDGIRPAGNAGAWEVAARLSEIDLNDAGVQGGEQKNITLGLNYYASARVRFMGNLVFVNARLPDGQTDKPKIVAFRTQYSF